MSDPAALPPQPSLVDRLIRFCLENKLVVALFLLFFVGWGIAVAPFDWKMSVIPRLPVPTDAIPDIGENQQIVFTEWPGRSPQDVEDQVTYPLTVALLGIPDVKTVRSYSNFGFSSIFVVFKEGAEFYWTRSRILERLNSLPPGTLPPGVVPMLGPDATALGQIYWYTLEGRDPDGKPAGGWDQAELRTVQDWYVRYPLQSAEGIAQVASVGGFVSEYQVDVDPDAMRAYGVTLEEVFMAVRDANLDVGAGTIEVNRVEYTIRGLGFIKRVEDIENSVIKQRENVPVLVRQVAHVSRGPAMRRGALDKGGAEAVGGVAVVRYGFNPLEAIDNIRKKIAEVAPSLPKKTLPDGTVSQVTIVPFYDRTGLIHETLGTLNSALIEEILVTIIVVIVMVFHLRSSLLISATMPLAVLISFIAMRLFHVDANIVSLSGIAIAVGTIVDMGIIITENILRRLHEAAPDEDRLEVIYRASSEVGSAVLTSVSTTIVGFLPVFVMVGPEGKLFRPLAFTKTFCLFGSIIVALTIIPAGAHLLFGRKAPVTNPRGARRAAGWIVNIAALIAVGLLLTSHWLPLGPGKGFVRNLIFTATLVGGFMLFFRLFQHVYEPWLRWFLRHKLIFLTGPVILVVIGACVWLGFHRVFSPIPAAAQRLGVPSDGIKQSAFWIKGAEVFPGLGKEFMPPLDEGSFLFMPTTMPHAGIGEALDILSKQDRALEGIPEVSSVVGKIGRAETPLDPAPINMIETVIAYRPEYLSDESGQWRRFRLDAKATDLFRDEAGRPVPARDGQPYTVRGKFERDAQGRLVPDKRGAPFRLWRPELDPALNADREYWPGIRNTEDIWEKIVEAASVPGVTAAPRLQPIAARIVMLQSGMRAPMGVKVFGPSLEAIEDAALQIERLLKEIPVVRAEAVIADRIVGKPYLEIEINRAAIARYGLPIRRVQDVIQTAIGGDMITTTVEGRERYPVRVRYLRELRDRIESLGQILVPADDQAQIPLSELAEIRYVRGPMEIKSEDTALVGYVLFDRKAEYAEVDVVESCAQYLQSKRDSGDLRLEPGVRYRFAGSYENQIAAQRTLAWVLPLALFAIFMILYFQFKAIPTTLLVFLTIALCWASGFLMIWLYGQDWFLNVSVFGVNMRELFNLHTINLSVAIWVGFLALFGIASDDGVVIATYLDQSFARRAPATRDEVQEAVVAGGTRRVRACLMTTATTVLALLPVLTSTGRGSDIMIPMAIPAFGGMLLEVFTMFLVPVLYCAVKEVKIKGGTPNAGMPADARPGA